MGWLNLKNKIDDVGVFVPNAKKDTFIDKPVECSGLFKQSLWPEPNWVVLSQRMDKESLVFMYLVYSSIRKSPRRDCGGVSKKDWASAYVSSIRFLREKFECPTEKLDSKKIESLFYDFFGYNKARPFSVKRDYPVFAAGGGSKMSLRTPFSLTKRLALLKNTLVGVDWPAVPVSKIREYAIHLRFDDGLYWAVCRLDGSRVVVLDFKGNRFDTAKDACQKISERLMRDKRTVYRPEKDLSGLRHERVVPHVTADMLLSSCGFRAVQFGNTVSQIARQRFLDNVYLSLEVLSEFFSIPMRWLGLGGVALAYGARGEPGASAHFEPDLNVINLTKKNGPSSFGHEMMHAIDYRLACSFGLKSGLLSDNAAVVGFVKDETKRAKLNALMELIDAIEQTDFFVRSHRLSDQKGGAQYWVKRSELLARGFEAVLECWMKEQKKRCDWLACGTQDVLLSKDIAPMYPYPLGEEVKSLTLAYRKFFSVLWSK